MLLKTRPGLYAELEAAIRATHPYELPAIQALPTAPAEPGRFITDQVRRCAGRPMSTGS